MQVVITIRKEVPDRDEARAAYNHVKESLADHDDLKITGHCTNHFEDEE